MEELFALRTAIEEQRYPDALLLIGELEEMSKDDKVNKIRSFAVILLLHLIKQHAEQRTTRSWDCSIANATEEIQFVNTRRRAKGSYLTAEELAEVMAEAYRLALRKAALEAFEGRYEATQLGAMVDAAAIQREALDLIKS